MRCAPHLPFHEHPVQHIAEGKEGLIPGSKHKAETRFGSGHVLQLAGLAGPADDVDATPAYGASLVFLVKRKDSGDAPTVLRDSVSGCGGVICECLYVRSTAIASRSRKH